ncbi:MAG: T9SS type A sorting domain-containing protein [Bacteroidetes bacterium]|nr:T9SS type A sorting domain-containing protein [Bacteroidota bacterium]
MQRLISGQFLGGLSSTAGSGTFFVIEGGGSATLSASQFIRFLPGTVVQETGILHAFITNHCIPCINLSLPRPNQEFAATSPARKVMTDQQPQLSIKIYPNPTSCNFTVESGDKSGKNHFRVEIYTLQGEHLITEELNGESSHVFSLSNQPAGVYFIRVTTETKVKTTSLILQ